VLHLELELKRIEPQRTNEEIVRREGRPMSSDSSRIQYRAGLNKNKASRPGLRYEWFDQWHPKIDEALKELPEMETCPHDLLRSLIQDNGAHQKRVVVISENDAPVALAALRKRAFRHFELITNWIVPQAIIPAQAGAFVRALASLSVSVEVAGWRWKFRPEPSELIKRLEYYPTYGMKCSEHFEKYWRKSGQWTTVKRCRNLCRDFTFAVNPPDGAEWIIKNWGDDWGGIPQGEIADRLIAARYLEQRGRHYSFLLYDKDKPIAGHTFLIDREDLVWQVTHRDKTYDRHGVGTRLMDLAFQWAAENGLQEIDLGGTHGNKARWAPQNGEKFVMNICPGYLSQWQSVLRLMKKIRLRTLKRKLETLITAKQSNLSPRD